MKLRPSIIGFPGLWSRIAWMFRMLVHFCCEREGHDHAGLLGGALEDQRSGRVQEIHGSGSSHSGQVWRQGLGARRTLSDHGRTAEVSPFRGGGIPDLRAGGGLFYLWGIRQCRGLPPQRRWRGGNQYRRQWRRDAVKTVGQPSDWASSGFERKPPRISRVSTGGGITSA